jgi:3-deoxy-D-manno-octulosonic acid kinase
LLSFVARTKNGQQALVREDWADGLASALFDGVDCVPVASAGRGDLLRFPYPGGHGLIRHYRRGGLVQHVLKDTYLFRNRPAGELKLLSYLYDKGLPVAEPLGACWERRGPWVRGAIATRELDAIHLLDYLRDAPSDAPTVLSRCGDVIRRMHDLHVFHNDLQVRNILIGGDQAYLIDFDNARLGFSLTRLERGRNLLRLRRSFRKNCLPDEHFGALCEGYGNVSWPGWLGALYDLKGALSDRVSRR